MFEIFTSRAALRTYLVAFALVGSLSFNACQCDSPPPIGPVDDEENSHVMPDDPSAYQIDLSA